MFRTVDKNVGKRGNQWVTAGPVNTVPTAIEPLTQSTFSSQITRCDIYFTAWNYCKLIATKVSLMNNFQIVHNYGHGGSGIGLHWGCAKEAAQLVMESLVPQHKL